MRFCKPIFAIALLLLTTACGHIHTANVAMEPNPLPPPGYRAACASLPLPFNAFISGCAPVQGEQVAVIETRG